MVIFHQRKSAGTSLVYSLARDFGVETWIDSTSPKTRKTIRNCRGKELFRELKKFESPDTVVASFHLHPTREVLDFIKDSKFRAVVLLRNPKPSSEAMQRHREIDNSFKWSNGAYGEQDPLPVLEEFNCNYRTLVGASHLFFISFEDVVSQYDAVLQGIARFYGIPEIQPRGYISKKRYSGEGVKTIDSCQKTDLTKIEKPHFCFNPDFKFNAYLTRVRWSYFPFLPRGLFHYPYLMWRKFNFLRRKL